MPEIGWQGRGVSLFKSTHSSRRLFVPEKYLLSMLREHSMISDALSFDCSNNK